MSIAHEGSPILHTSHITLATWVQRYLHEHSRIQTEGIPYYDIRNPRMKWDTSFDIALQPVSVTCEAQLMIIYQTATFYMISHTDPHPIPLFIIHCMPYHEGRSKLSIDIIDRWKDRPWPAPYLNDLYMAVEAEWGAPTPIAEVPGPMRGDDLQMPAAWRDYSGLLRKGVEIADIARLRGVEYSTVMAETSKARRAYGELLFPMHTTRKKTKT